MKIAYSLLIDEYVDAVRLEKADEQVLRLSCPVCFKPLALDAAQDGPRLMHAETAGAVPQPPCENRAQEFTPEHCKEHNLRARRKRIEFFQWVFFKELLGEDPEAHYGQPAMEELAEFKGKGALRWMPAWHLEFVKDVAKARVLDQVEFWRIGESHLAQVKGLLPHVPGGGYARQVQFQIAYDLMDYLLSPRLLAEDNYQWLFAHGFRLSLAKWVGGARLESGEDEEPAMKGQEGERVAAARILTSCACDLLSEDPKTVVKAVETLNEIWTEPTITPERMPLLMFLAAEIAGEMQTTLYRLPYIPLLECYERPCMPRLD